MVDASDIHGMHEVMDEPEDRQPRWNLSWSRLSPVQFKLDGFVVLKENEQVTLPDVGVKVTDVGAAIELFQSNHSIRLQFDFIARTSRG